MFQDMELLDLLKKHKEGEVTLVDVRSPKEFAEFHIPGSINIPLLNNEERAEVGTIYTQVGPKEAKKKGLELFSVKLPEFIEQFQSLGKERVVYCSRGGMRSKTAATVVDLMGIKVERLDGGIRSYRKWVMQQLETQTFTKRMYVLNGYTGSGKTILLRRLKKAGYPVLDLEKMANHRGSIFGQIGLRPNKQKAFDSLLVQELIRYENSPFLLMEGESKRIGKATLPANLHEKKESSVQLFIHLPLERRVEIILQEYHPEEYPEEIKEAFQRIRKHVHTPVAKEIAQNLSEENFSSAVALLLQYYYDPMYEKTLKRYAENSQKHIYAADVDEAFESVIRFIGDNEN